MVLFSVFFWIWVLINLNERHDWVFLVSFCMGFFPLKTWLQSQIKLYKFSKGCCVWKNYCVLTLTLKLAVTNHCWRTAFSPGSKSRGPEESSSKMRCGVLKWQVFLHLKFSSSKKCIFILFMALKLFRNFLWCCLFGEKNGVSSNGCSMQMPERKKQTKKWIFLSSLWLKQTDDIIFTCHKKLLRWIVFERERKKHLKKIVSNSFG